MKAEGGRQWRFVGVDLGGTNIKAGAVDGRGKKLSRISVPTEADRGPEHVVQRIAEAVAGAVRAARLRARQVTAVGVGSPGVMDHVGGVVLEAPNLPGFVDLPLRDMVAQRVALPTNLENDANAAAWGEFWAGAGRQIDSMVMFTLGTGIGGGIIADGHLIRGSHGHGAEVGHHAICADGRLCGCGRKGCLEAYASATAVVKRTAEALRAGRRSRLGRLWRQDPKALTSKRIFDAAADGDRLAVKIVRDTADYLAVGVMNLMHIVDPEMVVFTGGMIAAGRPFLELIRAAVKRRVFPMLARKTRIVYAKLGDDAGFIGAAGCAKVAYETSRS